MPGCKVGDMAILIKDPDFHEEGMIVEVLKYAPGPDGSAEWQCRTKDGRRMRCWIRLGPFVVPWWGRTCDIADDNLQPIRGLPKAATTDRGQPVEREAAA